MDLYGWTWSFMTLYCLYVLFPSAAILKMHPTVKLVSFDLIFTAFISFCQFFYIYSIHFFFVVVAMSLFVISSFFSVLKVSSHSEPSSQSLSLQQPAQPPLPPPPPPQPQFGLSVPESRDKLLCFSDFEDLSASFRSLYKCVFEQPFSQPGGCQPSVWISVAVHKKESVWTGKHFVNLLSGFMLIVNWYA